MTIIQKTADLSDDARLAIKRAIYELKPYAGDDLIAGLVSKMDALASAPAYVNVGKATVGLQKAAQEYVKGGWTEYDALVKAAAEHPELAEAHREGGGGPAVSEIEKSRPVDSGLTPLEKTERTLREATAAIRKGDPSLSEYEATMRALRADPTVAERVA